MTRVAINVLLANFRECDGFIAEKKLANLTGRHRMSLGVLHPICISAPASTVQADTKLDAPPVTP
jgi:hypothetical protein